MLKKYLLVIAMIFTCSILLMACGGSGDNEKKESESSENKAAETDADSEAESGEAEEESEDDDDGIKVSTGSSDVSDESSSEESLPDEIEIDAEVREDGVTFTLESISFKDDHISVEFNATNTTGHRVELASEGRARDGDLGGILLEDDTGYEYRYVAEGSDQRIGIMDGEEVTGSVSFEGRIQDDAEKLKLVFNPDEDQSNERAPIFSFENIKIER